MKCYFNCMIGEKLKILRKANNLSQKDVAKFIDKTTSAYGLYETNKNQPDIETLIKLADIFHTTVDNLIGHEVPYLIDTSSLSLKHIEFLNKVLSCTERECDLMSAYLDGLRK